MSSWKLLGEAVSDPYSLVGSAIATTFALAVAVYIAATISGGHVNPAVTFGMAVGGHISIMMAIFYWISQILGSVMACLLLKVATVGEFMQSCGSETWFNGNHWTADYRVYSRGKCFGIRPLHRFTGGSMNPEYSFGAALIGGSFKNQAVYWVGPLIGAAVAALIYDNMVFPSQAPLIL